MTSPPCVSTTYPLTSVRPPRRSTSPLHILPRRHAARAADSARNETAHVVDAAEEVVAAAGAARVGAGPASTVAAVASGCKPSIVVKPTIAIDAIASQLGNDGLVRPIVPCAAIMPSLGTAWDFRASGILGNDRDLDPTIARATAALVL